MERVRLARVEPSLPLLEAFKRIRPGTGAVVVNQPAGPVVVTASDMMKRRNSAVNAGEDLSIIPVSEAIGPPHQEKSREAPEGEESDLPAVLEIGKSRLIIVTIRDLAKTDDEGDALVITSSKTLARNLALSVTVCSCNGIPVHTYERWQIRKSDICGEFHSEIGEFIIKCSDASELPGG